MVRYDLEHLTQPASEAVCGPIQDTEALFLYSVVRGMRMKRILEIGGLSGYSATNFLKAFAKPAESVMYTVDINPVPAVAPNHVVIVKDARHIDASDLHNAPLDLVFFDCHDYDVQMALYRRLVSQGIVTDATVLALHDTNTHPARFFSFGYALDGNLNEWVHQDAERRMVNTFVQQFGYQSFSLHTPLSSHDHDMPYRHGVTLLQKFNILRT